MSFEETIYQLFARKSSLVTALHSFTKHSFKCKELLRNVQTQQISDRIIYYTAWIDISTYAMDVRILSSRQEACSLSTTAACAGSCCRHGRCDSDKRITVQTRDDRERRHHQLISYEWRHRRQQWRRTGKEGTNDLRIVCDFYFLTLRIKSCDTNILEGEERVSLNKYESFLRLLYLHRYCVVLYWSGFINGMTFVLFTVSQPQTTFCHQWASRFHKTKWFWWTLLNITLIEHIEYI